MKSKFWLACLAGLNIGFFSACQQGPSPADKLAEARQQADQAQLERFEQGHKPPVSNEPLSEWEQLLPVLDETAAPQVRKILVQNKADNPIAADSMLKLLGDSQTPKVAENAAMLMGVRDYKAAGQKIQQALQKHGAQIIDQEERHSELKQEQNLSIEVSPAKLQALMGELQDLALVIRQKRVWLQDLSARFVDLQTRIESKQLAQNRLREMLKTGKQAQDILPIQRELDAVTADLESLLRTAHSLSRRRAQSLLSLSYYQDLSPQNAQQADFGTRMMEGLGAGWLNFQESLVLLSNHWPYVVLGFVFLLLYLWRSAYVKARERKFQEQLLQAQQQLMLVQGKK